MIKIIIILSIITSSCGKKGKLYLDSQDNQRESIINQERIYKF